MSATEILALAHKEEPEQPKISTGQYFRDFEKRIDSMCEESDDKSNNAKSPKFFLNFLPPVTKKTGKSFGSKAKAKRFASQGRGGRQGSFLLDILSE